MPRCDVCDQTLDHAQGFVLTTQQVTTRLNYWEYILNKFEFEDETYLLYLQQQSIQRSGWLVCAACSPLFEFDASSARNAGQQKREPVGCGPADVNQVAAVAARAWKEKFGSYPKWLTEI